MPPLAAAAAAPPSRRPCPPALQAQGRSRIVRRNIPGFREIIVRAFECEDCRRTWVAALRALLRAAVPNLHPCSSLAMFAPWRRADEAQLAGQYDAQGVRLSLQVPQGCAATLSRQVLKSDTATVRHAWPPPSVPSCLCCCPVPYPATTPASGRYRQRGSLVQQGLSVTYPFHPPMFAACPSSSLRSGRGRMCRLPAT